MTAQLNRDTDGQTVDVRVSMAFKVRGGRKEIILSPNAKAQPNRPLVVALARAHRWQRMIDSGRVGSLEKLASLVGVDRSYVRRLLGLSTAAPQLVRAVLDGHEPSGLSAASLSRSLPLLWHEHRSAFGLSRGQE